MLLEVGEFCSRVDENLAEFIDELSEITNRSSENEKTAWRKSLTKLSIVLNQTGLQNFHISFGQPCGISIEYKLPAASAWCDAVILGHGAEKPTAVMIELKDWDTRGTKATEREGLIEHHGFYHSHPSDQVRGYVEYCQNFHSTILEHNANVAGCVFFTSSDSLEVLKQKPYEQLAQQYPVFSSHGNENQNSLNFYLQKHLIRPNFKFASEFEKGIYSQNRSLVQQIASLVQDESKTIFVLLDEQRIGFELCLNEINKILSSKTDNEKAVIIIEGPPGSGKSVLAAQLWATLIKDDRIQKSVVLTSTSKAQSTNWETLFEMQAKNRVGRGVIVKSNQYNPGLTSKWLKGMRENGHPLEISDWRENIKLYLQNNTSKMQDNAIEVSIVDEAHALIDPSTQGRRGVRSSGWTMQAGPQGYHIIRSSKISIFLMDTEQSYRDNETTDKESLKGWARELGVNRVQEISLGDAQFRCGGSKEYVNWIENLLDLHDDLEEPDISWRKLKEGIGIFDFEIVNTPQDLDEKLTPLWEKGRTVRLVSSYGREWKTKGIHNPHILQPSEKDFYIPYKKNGINEYWSRIWNYTPDSQYQYFIQAPIGSRMYNNPLCEVGCPYVVRGFDFDYLGVLWLNDLIWRNDRWTVNIESVHESAWNITAGQARKEAKKGMAGKGTEEIIQNLKKGYRILLSRAIRGIYIWFEDDETRQHVQKMLETNLEL